MDKGAHYRKCDFQVHTPRDLNWKGPHCVANGEREEYAKTLVQVCRDKNIHAIAITDHHDMTFVPYVRKAAEEETDEHGNLLTGEKQLVVFPGIELTLAVPCQAILILDADFEDNRFAAVLTALGITPSDSTQSKTAKTIRLEHIQSFRALKERLDSHRWLKDRYIVFPNVSSNGKFSILRKGMAIKYKEMPFVGGYIDGSISGLKEGNVNILAGKDREWGNKKTACIQTSDNRSSDHSLLGQHISWIKWAKPTAEALRQACLAQESRISHNQPVLPNSIITRISVSNSAFLGPIELSLNPQYNALIGGRGTGKSTILEYIRWTLCDQPPTTDGEDIPNYELRRQKLIENTLKPHNAVIDVEFIINNVSHVVRRDSKDGSVLVKVGTDEMRPCSEEEVRTLLPIQAYSQKQLSNVSIRIEELSRFITSPIRSELFDLSKRIEEKKVRLRQTYASRRRRQVLEKEISKRGLEEQSLQKQADSIRTSLAGLSIEDRALLDNGKVYDGTSMKIEGWLTDLSSLSDSTNKLVHTLKANLDQTLEVPTEPEPEILKAIYDEYVTVIQEAIKALEKISLRANTIAENSRKEDENPWRQWHQKLTAFKAAYQAAVQRSSAQKERMDELQVIEQRLIAHQKETARLKDELRKLELEGDVYSNERNQWHAYLAQRDTLLDNQCRVLTQESDDTIRATVRRFADSKQFTTKLKAVLTGSGVRKEKQDDIGNAIINANDPQKKWVEVLNDLESLAIFDSEGEGEERRPEAETLASIGLSNSDLNRLAKKLSSEDWLTLSLVEIDSQPVFEYQSRESEYIPFSNASAGQQATALLKTLLNQNGPPLLIDQPEEDLDNPIMQTIVEEIWKAKQKRQLIFVSHNANLVVNGDAELVAWCDYRRAGDQSGGKIAGEGAIDIPDIREAIKRIMEGGEAAFKLRRQKYGF